MKNYTRTLFTLAVCAASYTVSAEPRTVPLTISSLRAYTEGTYFVNVNTSSMATGSPCTTTYTVNKDDAGGKNVIATLLTAKASGSTVQIEINTTDGCTGYGTAIQSVFLL